VLATSREPLGVPGETLHPVDALPDDEAERLFGDRGAAVRPGFAVTDDLRPTVREICRRLDAWFWMIRGLFAVRRPSTSRRRVHSTTPLATMQRRRPPAPCARPTGRWWRRARATSPRRP
jgi:predicted ATPase